MFVCMCIYVCMLYMNMHVCVLITYDINYLYKFTVLCIDIMVCKLMELEKQF